MKASNWFNRTTTTTATHRHPATRPRESPRKRRLEVFGEEEVENMLLQEDKPEAGSSASTSQLSTKRPRQDSRRQYRYLLL